MSRALNISREVSVVAWLDQQGISPTKLMRAVVSVLQRAGATGATLPAHIEGGQHAADIARELSAEVVIPDTSPPQPHGWRCVGSRWVARVLPGDVPAALEEAALQGLDIDQTRYVVLVASRRRE